MHHRSAKAEFALSIYLLFIESNGFSSSFSPYQIRKKNAEHSVLLLESHYDRWSNNNVPPFEYNGSSSVTKTSSQSHVPRWDDQVSSLGSHRADPAMNTASVQFMITQEMKRILIEELRYTREQVRYMTPDQAVSILNNSQYQSTAAKTQNHYDSPPPSYHTYDDQDDSRQMQKHWYDYSSPRSESIMNERDNYDFNASPSEHGGSSHSFVSSDTSSHQNGSRQNQYDRVQNNFDDPRYDYHNDYTKSSFATNPLQEGSYDSPASETSCDPKSHMPAAQSQSGLSLAQLQQGEQQIRLLTPQNFEFDTSASSLTSYRVNSNRES